jgi:DNA-binding IclR family transcriptional regulator
MKSPLDPIKSSAPALNRGLQIIQVLENSLPLTLEQIANHLKIPKASALRLLDTLDKLEIIQKSADKRYEALWKLSPINSSLDVFRAKLEARMVQLMKTTGDTVEWYEPTAAGMQLSRQKNPETELCVKARPGFLRDWQTELEAVALLGHAFSDHATPPSQSLRYTKNGVRESLQKQEIQLLIQKAKAQQTAYDIVFNENGVRRFAIAAFDRSTNDFIGVLAVAETYHFSRAADPNQMLQLLKSTLT